MNRRHFLKFGIAGALLAGGAGWLGKHFAKVQIVPGQPVVQPQHYPMLRAVAAGLLEGALPQGGVSGALDRAVQSFIVSSQTLAAAAQSELGQLLNILENPVGRRLIADLGSDWEQATPAQVQRFLADFRDHPIPALQPGYHALHDLMMASWYSQPSEWEAMAYPGPPFKLA
ncbi:hypothetical protein [Limnobacter sp.]|uniref:hypothetical protein n=1 Tax=Limnobacter sp. TaxID=2003368 RepID=UPI0035189C37